MRVGACGRGLRPAPGRLREPPKAAACGGVFQLKSDADCASLPAWDTTVPVRGARWERPAVDDGYGDDATLP